MTLIRHRQPVERVVLEPKMLLSGVVCVSHVVVGSVTLLPVVGVCVVGVFLTVKPRDWAPHSFSVNTMVRFSPAGRGGGVVAVKKKERLTSRYVFELCVGLIVKRTAVENGKVGEVRPAGAEQDGGVSGQSAYAVPTGVLQSGCYSQSRHSH